MSRSPVPPRTTAYHPQGDGMVERFNRSVLQLYVEKEEDWERHLNLALFAYRIAVHSSTGVSPFVMMFGRQPKLPPHVNAFDSTAYMCIKFHCLDDFVRDHLERAAQHQKTAYDQHSKVRKFQVGQPVWLSVPTAGKLDPRWEGKWKVTKIKTAGKLDPRWEGQWKVTKIKTAGKLDPRWEGQWKVTKIKTAGKLDPRWEGKWKVTKIKTAGKLDPRWEGKWKVTKIKMAGKLRSSGQAGHS